MMNPNVVETASGLIVPASAVEQVAEAARSAAATNAVRERRPINVGDVFVLEGLPFRVHRVNGKKREIVLRVAREVRDTTIRKAPIDAAYVDTSGGRD